MCPEGGLRIILNQLSIVKTMITPWFADTKPWSIFFDFLCFSCQFRLLVQASCQYHYWFWGYALRDMARNPDIGNFHIWVFSNVSGQTLLNAAKCQVCSLYRFWFIRGKPSGGLPLPIRLIRHSDNNNDKQKSWLSCIMPKISAIIVSKMSAW